jgi:hypothetical protein
MLFGGFLITDEQMNFEQVVDLFGTVDGGSTLISPDTTWASAHDSWRALSHATSLGWLHARGAQKAPNASDSRKDSDIEVEEMLHYASPINGSIYMVVPNKILCFPTPAALPDNQLWMDSGDGTVRRFSAAFYADLFAELGVDVVMCLHASACDRAAFLAQGIEVEDLGTDPGGPHMLRAIDRFLAVAAAAPGPVALHSGAEDGPGHLGALVLSYLTGRAGFDSESAVAWVRMVHPALLDTPASPPVPAAALRDDGPLARAPSAEPPSPPAFTHEPPSPCSRQFRSP